MATGQYKQLSQQDVDHFMQHGFVKLSDCFTQEQADDAISNLWTRLGMSPTDKSTWHTERINMPAHKEFPVADFAPKAWAGICDLLGEDRVSEPSSVWRDAFIVNFGTTAGDGKDIRPQDLPGWHVDGDFFAHYLDSPEQGLLVIPLFTEIKPSGGGTMICPAAIPKIAKELYDHPEGVSPYMVPRADNPDWSLKPSLSYYCDVAKSMPDEAFFEATGKVGDVYLLHPLMMHSASNNKLRAFRVITNPPVSMKEPFVFGREDGIPMSIVEKYTLAALGKENLDDWKITGTRDKIIPERIRRQEAMRKAELERLEELKKKNMVDVNSTSEIKV